MTAALKTHKEWNDLGFWIKKGERHIKRDAYGVCLFSQDQTIKAAKPNRKARRSRAACFCGEQDMDFADYYAEMVGYGRDY